MGASISEYRGMHDLACQIQWYHMRHITVTPHIQYTGFHCIVRFFLLTSFYDFLIDCRVYPLR